MATPPLTKTAWLRQPSEPKRRRAALPREGRRVPARETDRARSTKILAPLARHWLNGAKLKLTTRMPATITIREADWRDPAHGAGLIEVLDSYACGDAGGSSPLPDDVKRRLVPALAEQPTSLVLLAFAAERVVGAATCFFGFSTFAARPLLNVHDLAVLPEFRSQGIGRALLAAAEHRARARGCAKLTLEVLEANQGARRLYESVGFRDFELAGSPVRTHFLSKSLKA